MIYHSRTNIKILLNYLKYNIRKYWCNAAHNSVLYALLLTAGREKTPFLITTFQNHFNKKITIQLDAICDV